jgi:hypothetical protein
MSLDNTEYESSEARAIIRKEYEAFEIERSKQKEESEALKIKLNKAEQLEKYEKDYQEGIQQTLKETEELLGNKTTLRTFKKLSDIDEITTATIINGLKDDYSSDQIKDYFNNLAQERDFNKFDAERYKDKNGTVKLTKDLIRDMDKFLKSKEGQSEQKLENQYETKKEPAKEPRQVSKIDGNIHPEKVSGGGFQGNTRYSESNKGKFAKEAYRRAQEILSNSNF